MKFKRPEIGIDVSQPDPIISCRSVAAEATVECYINGRRKRRLQATGKLEEEEQRQEEVGRVPHCSEREMLWKKMIKMRSYTLIVCKKDKYFLNELIASQSKCLIDSSIVVGELNYSLQSTKDIEEHYRIQTIL